jgi:hypothetical protein
MSNHYYVGDIWKIAPNIVRRAAQGLTALDGDTCTFRWPVTCVVQWHGKEYQITKRGSEISIAVEPMVPKDYMVGGPAPCPICGAKVMLTCNCGDDFIE